MGRRTRAIQSVAEIGAPGERKREGGRALITQLASTLQGEINPSTIAATVPSPLEAGWRKTDGVSYFFVLDLSNTQVNGASVALTGVGAAASATVFNESPRSVALSGGKLTDDFAPYALHIYVVQ